jgi:pyruvate kinase
MVSTERPGAPILAVAASPETARRLALCWGLSAVVLPRDEHEDPLAFAPELSRELGLAERGEFILLVSGGQTEQERSAPSIRILSA